MNDGADAATAVMAERSEVGCAPCGMTQRRRAARFPICCVLHVTPLDPEGRPLDAETVQVVGKDLSTGGVAFSHQSPLECHRAIVMFSHPTVGRMCVEVEVVRTRPLDGGLYETGCKFIRKLKPDD